MTFEIREVGARRTFAVLLAANVSMGFIGFGTSSLAARLLSPAGRGELAAVQNIPNLLAILASLGLGEAALYQASRQPLATKAIVRRALGLTIYGSIGMFLVGLVVLPLALSSHTTRTSALLSMPIVFIVPAYMVAHQPLRSIGHPVKWAGFRVSVACSWLAILSVAWLLHYRNARGVALVYIGAQGVVAVVALVLARRYPNEQEPSEPRLNRSLLRYGIPSSLVALPQVLNLRLDQILLTGIVARSDLGVYVAAVSWSWVTAPPFQALAQMALPRLATTPVDKRRRMVSLILAIAFGGAALTVAIMVPLTAHIFPLVMGSQYKAGVSVAQLLVVAGAVSGLVVVIEEVHRGLGRPFSVLAAEIAGVTITITLLLLLLHSYGIKGAAWVSILAYSIVVLGLLVLLPGTLRRAEQGGAGQPYDDHGQDEAVGQ